ncbi:hypothetical protein MVEN_01490600 [Mycena venus]|uniref:F-box domain-containing protein n=1 Tax=Mycena venus TaxID=2733690 RepID=A0A8H7CRA1_9AGAR|nr:hypothetical protein MVEN_01490600 [Mycena venus]
MTPRHLPLELQREIFEIAVRSNHKNAALKLNLSLVASHVHLWSVVDRIFYESVSIIGFTGAIKFLDLINLKPPGFLATTVKTLLLHFIPADDCVRILSACSGVQSLAVWNARMQTTLFPQISQLSLRRLCMSFVPVTDILAAATIPAWLSNITHLDIHCLDAPNFAIFGRLPNLTHVTLPLNEAVPLIANAVCASCPTLQIVVIVCGKLPATAVIDSYSFDLRIVVAVFPSDDVGDWEASHFGLPDMWTSAERVVAKRKKALATLRSIDNSA